MNKKNNGLVPVKIKRLRDKKDNHYHIIMEDYQDKHISVGLTTEPRKGKSKKAGRNYPLDIDPLNTGKKVYMKRQGTVERKYAYKNNYKGKMTSKDYIKAREYGNRAKQKYIQSKKK